MDTPPTPGYDGYINEIRRIQTSPDHVAILYFASIGGRGPQGKEWKDADREQISHDIGELASTVQTPDNALFIVAFPHVTKFLGWQVGSETTRETNLIQFDFRQTNGLAPQPYDPRELGCLLEIEIMRHETQLWANAPTPDAYFAASRDTTLAIKAHEPNKLYKEVSDN